MLCKSKGEALYILTLLALLIAAPSLGMANEIIPPISSSGKNSLFDQVTPHSSPSIILVPGHFQTIQQAIDSAQNMDTIVVAPGTYFENINFNGKTVKLTSQKGPHLTVINGNMLGSTVTFDSGESEDSILTGFTITNGCGTHNHPSGICGGGIFCINSSPSIVNNIIDSNILDYGYLRDKGGYLENTGVGGGIFLAYSNAVLLNNLIVNNYADCKGGGIACGESNLTMVNNSISKNQAGIAGGIYCSAESVIEMRNSIIFYNFATEVPGIVLRVSSVLTISYSDIDGGEYAVSKSPESILNWGPGMIDLQPHFVIGPRGKYYLSQIVAGQFIDSPCLDAGDPGSKVSMSRTTRTDEVQDLWPIDMGFHYFGK
jgi:hypothetical protein